MISNSKSRKVFQVINTAVIVAVTASCLIPLLNVLAISLSNSQAIVANEVGIWPKMFTADAYSYVMKSTKFWTSAAVSLKRVVIGVPLSILLTLLAAYPLSKPELAFPARKYYVAYLLVVMVFNGGLIPTYYVISQLNMIDTVWALTLPCAVNIFSRMPPADNPPHIWP